MWAERTSEFRLLWKNAKILTICTNQISSYNIVFYWKVEAKEAKKRAKRASELRLLKQRNEDARFAGIRVPFTLKKYEYIFTIL